MEKGKHDSRRYSGERRRSAPQTSQTSEAVAAHVLRLDALKDERRGSNPSCRAPQSSRRNSWHERRQTSELLASGRMQSRRGSWFPNTEHESLKEEGHSDTITFLSNRSSTSVAAPKDIPGELLQAKTILFVAVPPRSHPLTGSPRAKNSAVSPSRAAPVIFHVHVPLLRAYAPLLYSRLTALTVAGLDPSVSQDGATPSQEPWSHMGRGVRPWSRQLRPAEQNVPSSMHFVLEEGIPPEVHMECSQRLFTQVINWMYGSPLNISLEDMNDWGMESGKGCELLVVARDLGMDALEMAVRRTIFEAVSRCGSKLAWTLLTVCHTHGLQRELEHCCTVIARNAGYGISRARLRPLSWEVLDMLLSSRCWILDEENDIITIIELWMECSPLFNNPVQSQSRSGSPTLGLRPSVASRPSSAAVKAKNRSSRMLGNKLEVMPNEGGGPRRRSFTPGETRASMGVRGSTDIRGGLGIRGSVGIQHEMPGVLMDMTGRDSVFMASSPTGEEAEPEESGMKSETLMRKENYRHSALWNVRWGMVERKRLEALGKAGLLPRSLLLDIDKWTHMIDNVTDSKRMSSLMMFQKDHVNNERKLKEATSILRLNEQKLETMKQKEVAIDLQEKQEKVTQEARVAVDDAEKVVAKSKEVLKLQQQGGKSQGVKLSTATSKWRKMNAQQQEEEDVVRRFLFSAGRRLPSKKKDAENKDKDADTKEEEKFDENVVATIYCPWLRRRRAHHGSAHCPISWQQHLTSFSAERDRISMTLRPAIQLRNSQSNFFTLTSERLMRKGRHEFMLRVTQRRGIAGQAGNWNGFRFGLGVYDVKQLGAASEHPGCEPARVEENEELAETKMGSRLSSSRYTPRGIPPDVLWASEGTLERCLNKREWDPSEEVPEGGLVDLVVLLTYEDTCPFRMTAESIVCESSESSAFLRRHDFFDRWSMEQTLDEELVSGAFSPTLETPHTWFCFCVEVHSKTLACSGGLESNTVVSLEVLPQGALQRSWWVDIMDRSADGQPHSGADGPPQWNVLPKEEGIRRARTSVNHFSGNVLH